MTTKERAQQTQAQLAERRKHILERRALLPTNINAPIRENTAVCMPSHDGKIELRTMKGLMATMPRWHAFIDMPLCSHVGLARNRVIAGFLATSYEWCVMIDADIGFGPQDMEYLMETHATPQGLEFAVNGVYAVKDESAKPIAVGLGFARVHRSVFEVLDKTLCRRFIHSHTGQEMTDFFLSGAIGNDIWMGEDATFWMLCAEIGVIPRMEKRVKLVHVGRAEYRVSEFDL